MSIPSPCACDGRLSGIRRGKCDILSVSRLKPRRKYWLLATAAVLMMRRNRLRTSPERRIGRSWISVAPTVPWVPDSAIPTSHLRCTLMVVLTAPLQRDAQRAGARRQCDKISWFQTGLKHELIFAAGSRNNEGAVPAVVSCLVQYVALRTARSPAITAQRVNDSS